VRALRIAESSCRSDLAHVYDLHERLGTGASAEVYRASHQVYGHDVAIKIFSDSRSETIHAACTEFVCATRSAGPGALEYMECAFYQQRPALVMELGVQGLDGFIKVRLWPMGYSVL
jgi:serine/threonine protein kinase